MGDYLAKGMMWMLRRCIFAVALLLPVLFMSANLAEAGAFEHANTAKGVPSAIGEIACHGEDELEDQMMTGLEDAYADAFTVSDKFRLTSPVQNKALMSTVHKDAIVHGHFYNRGHSNADLIRYANEVLGRNYRPTDDEYKEIRKNAGKPYKLSPQVASDLKQYATDNGIRYFLFCNVSHIEVWLKKTIFSQNDFERGKTLTIEMEYYLVDAKTGYVYDGFSHESKTANMINALIVQGGKNMPVNMLFQRVMEEQVKKVVNDMGSKGLDRLKAVSGT